MVYDLLKLGLFTDESGVMSNRTRGKLFEILGFGNWVNSRDLDEAHIGKAMRENIILEGEYVVPDVVDDHKTHITEHTKLAISQRCGNDPEFYDRVLRHITAHKEYSTLEQGVSDLTRQMEEL